MSSEVVEKIARVLAEVDRQGPRSAERLGLAYQAELARDRRGRQQAAAFYTPPKLVEFVAGLALGPALLDRSEDEILSLRVLDPACGAGVFLVEALRLIETSLIARGRRGGHELRAEIAARCLRGVDVDPVATALCHIAVDTAVGATSAPAIACTDSLFLNHPTCDVVVTNPPWGQKNLRFDPPTRARLRRRYKTAAGVLDPFKLFVELAIETVAEGGRWAMVLPDIVLLKNHEATRRLMLGSSSLEWIVHVGRVFRGVNLDACVIVGKRGEARADHEVKTAVSSPKRWIEGGGQDEIDRPRRRKQRVFAGLPGAKLNIVASDADLELVERLRRLPRLGDHFEIHEGVHSGNRRAALFRLAPRAPSAAIVVGGSELAPYQLRWGGRYVDLDPLAIDRDAGGYASLGRPEWHLRKKIVVRRTGDRMVVAFDGVGRFVSNNFFVVVPKLAISDRDQRAVVGLLGSSFMTRYFRTIQPRAGRLFAELKINQLADFPLAPLCSREISLVAGMVEAMERAGQPADLSELNRCVLDRHIDDAYTRCATGE